MDAFSLSVVLPAYNEEQNIKETVLSCIKYLSKNFNEFEILVVNDGSSDKTKDIVAELSNKFREVMLISHNNNQGYGSALNSGLESAVMDYIFFMDSDGQFDFSEISILIELLSERNVVIGYRVGRADNLIRRLNAYLYNLYIKLFFGLKVIDIDCAFKLFPKSAFDSVKPLKSRGALYSAELLIKFVRNGFEIKEVGVNHYPRSFGKQSGASLSVILKMFKESWDFRNDLR